MLARRREKGRGRPGRRRPRSPLRQGYWSPPANCDVCGVGAGDRSGAVAVSSWIPPSPARPARPARSSGRHDERKRQKFGEVRNELDRVAELVGCDSDNVVLQLSSPCAGFCPMNWMSLAKGLGNFGESIDDPTQVVWITGSHCRRWEVSPCRGRPRHRIRHRRARGIHDLRRRISLRRRSHRRGRRPLDRCPSWWRPGSTFARSRPR